MSLSTHEVNEIDFHNAIEQATHIILKAIQKRFGFCTTGENFDDTPARVARSYKEIVSGLGVTDEELSQILSRTFPTKNSEMVVQGPVRVWSLCPHHLLPMQLDIWMGYIPNGSALGLSKLARLAEILGKRPVLQEDLTIKIAEKLNRVGGISTRSRVLGAGCLIRGRHLCMEMRGVKQAAVTTTTSLFGSFLNQPATRAEFLATVERTIVS